jgi:hypothetical protein
MKKILRLVTTSVLTLTLVACGEASSSVSNGTTTSSSVSSTTSAFANVSTITLSAASDVLTQTMGTQKAVVVQAALNANTNPSLAIEWLVNGTKSNQTGRVFEYTPAAAGTFVITARVGSVVSNALTLNVGAPTFAITGDLKLVGNNRIEITAPGGATVTVANNTVQPSSIYDLAKGIYVIDLKTPLAHGDVATVTLTREGNQPVTKSVTYDLRSVSVDTLLDLGSDRSLGGVADTEIKATSGVYELTRPHTLKAADSTFNDPETDTNRKLFRVSFKSANLDAASVPFKLERVSAPAGAPAFLTLNGQAAVTTNNAAAQILEFDVGSDTLVGDYVYKYTLGVKSVDVTLRVVLPKTGLTFEQETIAVSGVDTKFDVFTETATIGQAISGAKTGVALGADGAYTITKDYLTTQYKQLTFKLDANNYSVPEAFLNNANNPNQLVTNLVGPDNISFMRIAAETNYAQEPLPTVQTIRGFFNDLTVTQRLDKTTPVGTYTYTVRVLQLGVEIDKKEVKIVLQNPVAKIEFVAGQTVKDNPANPANAVTRVVWNSGVNLNYGTFATKPATPADGAFYLSSDFLADGTTAAPAAGALLKYVTNAWTNATNTTVSADGLLASGAATPTVAHLLVDSTRKLLYTAVNSTSTLTAVSDVYTVERPLASATDNKVLSFDLKITNFESPANPAAALADSFTGDASTVKEFLSFGKRYSGPMTLASLNTANTKLAVELGSSTAAATIADRKTSASETYTRVDSATAEATLGGVFAMDVNNLTVLGDYVFTLNLGSLTKQFTVKVVAPAVKVNFSLSPSLVDTAFASATVLTVKDDVYTVNLSAVTSGNAKVRFNLSLDNAKPASGTTFAYKLTRTTPEWSDVTQDVVTFQGTDGTGTNLGTVLVPGLVTVLSKENPAANDTSLNELVITKEGTYKYVLEIAGLTKELTINVLPRPTLTVTKLTYGASDTEAVKFTLTDSHYLVPAAASTANQTVKLTVEGKNLPAIAWYKIQHNTAPVAKTALLTFVDGVATVEFLVNTTANTLSENVAFSLVNTLQNIQIELFDGTATAIGTNKIGEASVRVWYAPVNA